MAGFKGTHFIFLYFLGASKCMIPLLLLHQQEVKCSRPEVHFKEQSIELNFLYPRKLRGQSYFLLATIMAYLLSTLETSCILNNNNNNKV